MKRERQTEVDHADFWAPIEEVWLVLMGSYQRIMRQEPGMIYSFRRLLLNMLDLGVMG